MSDTPARPSLANLFTGFFTVGVCGFGGVMPWARWMVVEKRRWMTSAEFTDLLGLCQFLPGGNIINVSVAIGMRFGGVVGSAVCLIALMAAPMAIVLMLGLFYTRYSDMPMVRHGFGGLAAVASALVLAMAWKIAEPLRARPIGIGVAVATFVAITILHWPLAPVLVAAAGLSTLLAWRVSA